MKILMLRCLPALLPCSLFSVYHDVILFLMTSRVSVITSRFGVMTSRQHGVSHDVSIA